MLLHLCCYAPKHISVSRGDGKVTPLCETKRANERMDVRRLEGLMGMHRVMSASNHSAEEAVTVQKAESIAAG